MRRTHSLISLNHAGKRNELTHTHTHIHAPGRALSKKRKMPVDTLPHTWKYFSGHSNPKWFRQAIKPIFVCVSLFHAFKHCNKKVQYTGDGACLCASPASVLFNAISQASNVFSSSVAPFALFPLAHLVRVVSVCSKARWLHIWKEPVLLKRPVAAWKSATK